MEFRKIEEILKKEPAFRLKQIKKAVFLDLIGDWQEATTLPQDLRQKLSRECPITGLKAEKILTSKDSQTIKVLFELKDGPVVSSSNHFKIESVLMKHGSTGSPQVERRTVCVSSQVGCAMNCQFCATGQQGFKRNLSSSEIVDQVLFFARLIKKSDGKITNLVFMGMGEPFLNYDNVLEAIRTLNDKDGFNLGARHISISTCGIIEGIKELAQEKLQVNLAISLHASNNKLRLKLMPINKTYPIEKIMAAVDDYIKKTKRRVMFEYLMIDGINDSPLLAIELAKLLEKPLCFVNLISFNPIGHSQFKPSPGWKIKTCPRQNFVSSPSWKIKTCSQQNFVSSSNSKIKKFKEILEKAGIVVTQRYRFGKEIKAACGQLAGENI